MKVSYWRLKRKTVWGLNMILYNIYREAFFFTEVAERFSFLKKIFWNGKKREWNERVSHAAVINCSSHFKPKISLETFVVSMFVFWKWGHVRQIFFFKAQRWPNISISLTLSNPNVCQTTYKQRTQKNVTGIPRWQWSLPGCGFGVVVHIVHSPMRQHPLLPAAHTQRQKETSPAFALTIHTLQKYEKHQFSKILQLM